MRKSERMGLFILRVSLGLFLFLWGCDKLVEPDSAVHIFSHFYGLPFGQGMAWAAGSAEALLGLAIIAGAAQKYTYALGLLLHSISTLASWRELLTPFYAKHHLFLAAIPVLAGFICLNLMRGQDTICAWDHRGS